MSALISTVDGKTICNKQSEKRTKVRFTFLNSKKTIKGWQTKMRISRELNLCCDKLIEIFGSKLE